MQKGPVRMRTFAFEVSKEDRAASGHRRATPITDEYVTDCPARSGKSRSIQAVARSPLTLLCDSGCSNPTNKLFATIGEPATEPTTWAPGRARSINCTRLIGKSFSPAAAIVTICRMYCEPSSRTIDHSTCTARSLVSIATSKTSPGIVAASRGACGVGVRCLMVGSPAIFRCAASRIVPSLSRIAERLAQADICTVQPVADDQSA